MGRRDCRWHLVTCCDSGPVKTGCDYIRNLLLYFTGFCLHRHFQIEWFTLLFPPVEDKHYEGNLIQIFMAHDKGGKTFSRSGEKMVFRGLVIRGTAMFWGLLSLFTQSVRPQHKEKPSFCLDWGSSCFSLKKKTCGATCGATGKRFFSGHKLN